jgi:succinate dehydrogenase / fumarate reductase membrane anchor subunit
MVKSVLGVNQGLRDWLYQRVTAIFMVIYSAGLLGYIIMHPGLAYYEWHDLFTHLWVKVVTVLFILCLLVHAWIGMWTVFTDYIKSFVLNLIIQVVVFIALIGFFLEALLILWDI